MSYRDLFDASVSGGRIACIFRPESPACTDF